MVKQPPLALLVEDAPKIELIIFPMAPEDFMLSHVIPFLVVLPQELIVHFPVVQEPLLLIGLCIGIQRREMLLLGLDLTQM